MNALSSRSVALSLTALLAAVTLAGCGNDPDQVASDPTQSAEPSSPSESSEPTPTTEPEPSETEGSTDLVTVPVYFTGDTPQGPRLYREFRKVEADNPLAEAAALMVAGDALDDDYGTLFGEGSFASVSYTEGSGFVVELADAGYTTVADGMTKKAARIAAQQLVYTLQGVQQVREPVTVELGGAPTTLFGVDTAGGLTQAPEIDTLALVNVTSPEEGSTVTGTFTASGIASSFEATVPWQVLQGDEVVLEGFATAEGWIDKLYPWESAVDVSGLAPGDYIFRAATDDPSGGEGFGPTTDTKAITVK